MDTKEGYYRIEANGIVTDRFMVGGVPIPEIPVEAFPLIIGATLAMVYGFSKKKKVL